MTNIYRPTWLYVKQHNQTGLKYFGKTVEENPVSYKGSGVYWNSHLKKHGNDVTTIWCHLYEDEEQLVEEALAFSEYHDIVKSEAWANLQPENGRNGTCGPKSEEHKRRIGLAHKGRFVSEETRKKIGESSKGRFVSDETRAKHSAFVVSEETRKKHSNRVTGCHWWNNGTDYKFVKECPGPEWKQGRAGYSPHIKK